MEVSLLGVLPLAGKRHGKRPQRGPVTSRVTRRATASERAPARIPIRKPPPGPPATESHPPPTRRFHGAAPFPLDRSSPVDRSPHDPHKLISPRKPNSVPHISPTALCLIACAPPSSDRLLRSSTSRLHLLRCCP
jgi:hypothetical protein